MRVQFRSVDMRYNSFQSKPYMRYLHLTEKNRCVDSNKTERYNTLSRVIQLNVDTFLWFFYYVFLNLSISSDCRLFSLKSLGNIHNNRFMFLTKLFTETKAKPLVRNLAGYATINSTTNSRTLTTTKIPYYSTSTPKTF